MSFSTDLMGGGLDPPPIIEYDLPARELTILRKRVQIFYSSMPGIIPPVISFVPSDNPLRIIARYKQQNFGHKLVRELHQIVDQCVANGYEVFRTERYTEEAALNVRVLSCVIPVTFFTGVFGVNIQDFMVLISCPEGDGNIGIKCAYFCAPADKSFERKVLRSNGVVISSDTYGVADAGEVASIVGALFSGNVSSESRKATPIRNIRVRDEKE